MYYAQAQPWEKNAMLAVVKVAYCLPDFSSSSRYRSRRDAASAFCKSEGFSNFTAVAAVIWTSLHDRKDAPGAVPLLLVSQAELSRMQLPDLRAINIAENPEDVRPNWSHAPRNHDSRVLERVSAPCPPPSPCSCSKRRISWRRRSASWAGPL